MRSPYKPVSLNTNDPKGLILNGNCCLSYFVGVITATLCFVICTILPRIFNFESATGNNLPTKTLHLLISVIFQFIVSFIYCSVTTVVPFFVAFFLARKFKINSVWFFTIGGMLTGICLALVFPIIVPKPAINDTIPYAREALGFIPVNCLSGLAAGLAVVFTLKRSQS